MVNLLNNNKVVLLIVDGFGVGDENEGNAITQSNMETWNYLKSMYSHTTLYASGNEVGLPEGVMGNSEVGHLTIGSGRIIYQSLELINKQIQNKELENNPIIIDLTSKNADIKDIHLMGLLSDGKVHSDIQHLLSIIDIFSSKLSDTNIWIHAFTDGRDTSPTSSLTYLEQLESHITNIKNVHLATIMGRYYAMDRDKKWDRTKIAYDTLTNTNQLSESENYVDEIKSRYTSGETDEFLKPIVVNANGEIKNGDVVIFTNFRPDRARQLTQAFCNFDLPLTFKNINVNFICMTEYDKSLNLPILFQNKLVSNGLCETISNHGYNQIHIAETEKYAHVTYFINGGREEPFLNEERILIPSPKVSTYDLEPGMSTNKITDKVIDVINNNRHDFIVINFAAPDMVGHTGNIEATIKALEITDLAFKKIYEVCKQNGYTFMITSDHGNCEKLLDNGNIFTAHTTNAVPFLITLKNLNLVSNGGLKNVAPTVLDLLHIPVPIEMTEKSLIIK
ncbi:MAG: 2,3-bisphosphoglycerate-independent phosphoglycerate mutase [Candidatus Heimdallarchaeota archaeon]|nr:2,3-bisphosphoglycerate-independent phosphoglycerate mutase [Candidatus Heimdallarchaeota archaeon]